MSLVPLHAAAQSWVPTDISALGGASNSQSYAASDNCIVVGTYATAGANAHGVVRSGGNGCTDPGTLGGNTNPKAVNRAAQVAGYSSTETATHAFRWTASGGMADL